VYKSKQFLQEYRRTCAPADLKDVMVSEDVDKNTITLGGTLHTDDAKTRAADVAKSAAGPRVVANEISVQPVGAESQAKDEAAALDDGIENNYKAALITSRLNQQHISYSAKNGVLTLTGSVHTSGERKQAEQLAGHIPHVQQVINQIEVKH
jgi:osmotically-inducible protein OsmY